MVHLTVVERCRVPPPPRSVAAVSLPLTHLDIPWLLFAPNQPLFFYHSPLSTSHFKTTTLPTLKHALSLSLRSFFPLAGSLVMPTAASAAPHLEYTEDDSIYLTVAAAADAGDFNNLVADHPKTSRDFHRLVPELGSADGSKQPLLAIQITVFPETGVCMGFTLRNVVADWRTFNNFLRYWASLCRDGGVSEDDRRQVAFHDRSVILDPTGLGSTLLKEWWNINKNQHGIKYENGLANDMLRATFVFGPTQVDQIKKWILNRSGSTRWILSPYNMCCAFICVCWTKLHSINNGNKYNDSQDVCYFGYVAGGVPRFPYKVPDTYVGNCVGLARTSIARTKLLGADGLVHAMKAVSDRVSKMNEDIMCGAQNWISEWNAMRESDLHVVVTGPPNLRLYELDFGWGKPVKIEEVSIDTTGAFSITETRGKIGGIEVGVALTKSNMDAFSAIIHKQLNQIFDSA